MSHVFPHLVWVRVPAFSGGPMGRLEPGWPVLISFQFYVKMSSKCVLNVYPTETLGIRVPCPAAVSAAQSPPKMPRGAKGWWCPCVRTRPVLEGITTPSDPRSHMVVLPEA